MKDSLGLLTRKKLIAHLSFGNCFFLKNDLTIFQITEKDFEQRIVGAQVLYHPELKKKLPFEEVVYDLRLEEITVISLLIKSYNS